MYGFTPENFDYTEGNPDVEPLLQLIRSGNSDGLIEKYREMHPSDAHHAIHCAANFIHSGQELWLKQAVEPPLLNILGGLYSRWAFLARGGGRGAEVEPENWRQAQQLAGMAQEVLDRAFAAEPEDAVNYGFYILADFLAPQPTNPGLLFAGTRQRFELMQTGEGRRNMFAASAILLHCAPKWFGSVEEMMLMAEHAAPQQGGWLALKAQALFEELVWFAAFETETAPRLRYEMKMVSSSYGETLQALARQCWSEIEAGGLSPSERVYSANLMAGLLCSQGRYFRARRFLRFMRGCVTLYPWVLMSDPSAPISASINWKRIRAGLRPLPRPRSDHLL